MAIDEMKLHWANIENEMSNFGCFDIFGGAIITCHNPKCSHIIILHVCDFMKRVHLLNVDFSLLTGVTGHLYVVWLSCDFFLLHPFRLWNVTYHKYGQRRDERERQILK